MPIRRSWMLVSRLLLIAAFGCCLSPHRLRADEAICVRIVSPDDRIELSEAELRVDSVGWLVDQARYSGVRLDAWGVARLSDGALLIHGSLRAAAGSLTSMMLRSADDGATWQEVLPRRQGSAVSTVAEKPDGETAALVIWATEGPRLEALAVSRDAGVSWEMFDSPQGLPARQGYPVDLGEKDPRWILWWDLGHRCCRFASKRSADHWRRLRCEPESLYEGSCSAPAGDPHTLRVERVEDPESAAGSLRLEEWDPASERWTPTAVLPTEFQISVRDCSSR